MSGLVGAAPRRQDQRESVTTIWRDRRTWESQPTIARSWMKNAENACSVRALVFDDEFLPWSRERTEVS